MAAKQVNMAETPVDLDKQLDSKQQEWMVDFIRQDVEKLIKGKQHKRHAVNFALTDEFVGMIGDSNRNCEYQIYN